MCKDRYNTVARCEAMERRPSPPPTSPPPTLRPSTTLPPPTRLPPTPAPPTGACCVIDTEEPCVGGITLLECARRDGLFKQGATCEETRCCCTNCDCQEFGTEQCHVTTCDLKKRTCTDRRIAECPPECSPSTTTTTTSTTVAPSPPATVAPEFAHLTAVTDENAAFAYYYCREAFECGDGTEELCRSGNAPSVCDVFDCCSMRNIPLTQPDEYTDDK